MKIDKTILVIDHAEFSFMAKYLAQYFKRVLLTTDWTSGFPYYGAKNIGVGIDGVERVNEWEDYEDEIDIIYFTDLYFMGTANRLKRRIAIDLEWKDKRVWGSGDFEMVERNRHTFYDLCVEAGLNTPPTVFIKGYEALMEYLKGKKDLWVKLTEYRGSGETFHWQDDNFNEFFSLELKRQLGVGIYDTELEFLVQETIDTELEWGVDTYLVDSEFPENMYVGFENKCESYFARLEKVRDMPDEWQEVLSKFEKVIKKYHFTGDFSMEVRIGKDGKQYFIDPCCRLSYPATAARMYGTTNYGQILVNALYDNKTTKVEGKKYVAEIVVRTSILNNWIPVYIDKGFEDNVMLVNNIIDVNGISWRCPPEQLYADSLKHCSPVGGGSTLEKAIQEATNAIKAVTSKGLEYSNTLLADSEKIVKQLKETCKYNF